MLPTLLMLTASTPVHAGDFMDVWVSTAFEDDNVRAGPDEYSPSANFVMRGNQTFFENYEARYSDDITQGHLVLYRRDEAFWPGWYTEAAFVLQFSPYLDPDDTDPGVDLEDDGSYVRVIRAIGDDLDHTVSLTGYAIDASRFRLGYSYDLAYGGKEIMARTVGAMPGARLQWENSGNYAFVGAKSAISSRTEVEWEGDRNAAYYAFLLGGGIALGDSIRIEGGAGLFQQGQLENVPDASSPLYGEIISARGFSAQVAYRTTTELDFIQSSELRLYRNSPDHVRDTYISHSSVDGVGLLVQAELNTLDHNLLDPDPPGGTEQTVVERAYAGDVQARLVVQNTEYGVDAVYKDLPYILFNIPGLTSGVALPEDLESTDQAYVRGSVTQYYPEWHYAVGVGVGYMRPATYTTSEGTFIQYDERNKEGVPDGEEAQNILSVVWSNQLDLSKSMIAVAEFLYTQDPNLSEVVTNDDGGTTRVAKAENVQKALGFNLILRARF